MRFKLLSAALVLALAPALAHADSEPVATAGAGSPPVAASSDEPIILGDSAAPPPAEPGADRKLHGEVGIAAGTGGYRSGYLILEAPLGERGQVGIAVGATRSNRGGPGGYYPAGPDTLGPYRPEERCEVITRDGAPPPPDSTPLCGAPAGEP